jgi:quercetin dioxygenase-like cupin family protein
MQRTRLVTLTLTAFLGALCLLVIGTSRGLTRDSVASLLSTGQTVIGQPIAYPSAKAAKITSVIVTMLPGEKTGWHQHDVPMFGYILEGEVTVDYGVKGTRVYRQGDAVMEAEDWPHDGHNTGTVPARILAVFMGAEGIPNTVMTPNPPVP